MSRNSAVAIVDDDVSIRDALSDLLGSYGVSSQSFQSAEEFLCGACRAEVCCLLLDVDMPGRSGIELQALLAAEPNPPAIIFVTSSQDERTRAAAMKAGAVAYLPKPVDISILMSAIALVASRATI